LFFFLRQLCVAIFSFVQVADGERVRSSSPLLLFIPIPPRSSESGRRSILFGFSGYWETMGSFFSPQSSPASPVPLESALVTDRNSILSSGDLQLLSSCQRVSPSSEASPLFVN